MKIRYWQRVGWGVFLFQIMVGGALWHRLPDGKNAALPGSAERMAPTVPALSPERPDFEVEAALSALSAAVERSPEENDFQERIRGCLRSLSAEQVVMMLQAAVRETKQVTGKQTIAALFGQLAALDPGQALALAVTLPPDTADATLGLLLRFWSERDLPGASRWYETNVSARLTDYPEVRKNMEKWAPRGLAARSASRPFGEILTEYRAARAARGPGNWIGLDAKPLLDHLSQTKDWTKGLAVCVEDPSLQREIHRLWRGEDPVGWLDWMRGHPAVGRGEGESAVKRQDLFADYLRYSILPDNGRLPANAVGPLLDQAVAIFAAEGLDFATDKPSASGIPGAFLHVFGNWLKCQPLPASAWLKRYQQESWSDPLIAKLVTTVVKDDPFAAFEWAARIKVDSRRREAFVKSYEVWRELDPAAADTWAAAHPAEWKPDTVP